MSAKNYREALRQRVGNRFRCRAVVERFGTKASFRGPPKETILLRDIVDAADGTGLTGHQWFETGKWSADLAAGYTFEFDGRVAEYNKGYQGRREGVYAPISQDWKLTRPTKVTIISQD